MKRTAILIIISVLLIFPTVVPAQTQGAPGRPYKMNQALVSDIHLMTGMMTDIDHMIGRGDITVQQRQQVMKIMGGMGAIMQEMGAGGEIEGWRLGQERGRLNKLRKQLDGLKKQIEGNKK